MKFWGLHEDQEVSSNTTVADKEDTVATVVNDRGPQIINTLRRDLAIASILTPIGSVCKALVGKMPCPAKLWRILKTTFKAFSKAAIDAKISKLQTMKLKKGERVVSYSNRMVELVSELSSASHISRTEMKRALLRGFTKKLISMQSPSWLLDWVIMKLWLSLK